MTTPFDAIAPRYDALWSGTEEGCRQRAEVWGVIEELFRPGGVVLDLGCGTGDDAVHLASRGMRVMGIDSSRAMVEVARSRGVAARQLAIEDLALLDGVFDGALSNFGALNCVEDLEGAARELARLIRPGGKLALCFISRFCWRETVSFLARFEMRRAVRRWRGHARWRGMYVYYPSVRRIRGAFDPCFRLVRRVSIGGGDHALYVLERRQSC